MSKNDYTYLVTYAVKGDSEGSAQTVAVGASNIDEAVESFRTTYSDETFCILGVAREIKLSFHNR